MALKINATLWAVQNTFGTGPNANALKIKFFTAKYNRGICGNKD